MHSQGPLAEIVATAPQPALQLLVTPRQVAPEQCVVRLRENELIGEIFVAGADEHRPHWRERGFELSGAIQLRANERALNAGLENGPEHAAVSRSRALPMSESQRLFPMAATTCEPEA